MLYATRVAPMKLSAYLKQYRSESRQSRLAIPSQNKKRSNTTSHANASVASLFILPHRTNPFFSNIHY